MTGTRRQIIVNETALPGQLRRPLIEKIAELVQ